MQQAFVSPGDDTARREAVIETARALIVQGINQGTSGNVSLRAGSGFLITPSGVPCDAMVPEQIVAMDLGGDFDGVWLPSSEWRMHRDIYRARPEVGAVVHTHSVHATALSCLRREIPAFHYMVAVAGGTSLRCADYATFGTQTLSDAMLRALEGRSACLLANHGVIATGPSLDKALWLAGEIETLCHQYTVACQTGTPVILSDAEMAEVLARFAEYGKQPAKPAPEARG